MAKGSRRNKKFNWCRGKTRYGSAAEALQEQPSMFPYQCSHCQCWHLTSKGPK